MRAKNRMYFAYSIWMVLAVSAARACPLCDSGTGQSVRAAILDSSFIDNVLVMMLPFVALALVAAAVNIRWSALLSSHKPTLVEQKHLWPKRSDQ